MVVVPAMAAALYSVSGRTHLRFRQSRSSHASSVGKRATKRTPCLPPFLSLVRGVSTRRETFGRRPQFPVAGTALSFAVSLRSAPTNSRPPRERVLALTSVGHDQRPLRRIQAIAATYSTGRATDRSLARARVRRIHDAARR